MYTEMADLKEMFDHKAAIAEADAREKNKQENMKKKRTERSE